jgi:predicted Zn finger-like uncharacterized protein
MIVVCPSCATRYRLPAGTIGPAGRKVRCRNCQHQWQVTDDGSAGPETDDTEPGSEPTPPAAPVPEVPVTAPAAPPEVSHAPLPPVRPAAPARGDRLAGLVAWAGLALLVLLVAALYVGRERVAELAPWTAPIYRDFGLAVGSGHGVELREHSSERRPSGGQFVLTVRGTLANVSGEPRPVGRLRIMLLDEKGGEVAVGLFDPAERELAAGASTSFEAEFRDPPATARSYRIAFAD